MTETKIDFSFRREKEKNYQKLLVSVKEAQYYTKGALKQRRMT
jgi:hypothetical protein